MTRPKLTGYIKIPKVLLKDPKYSSLAPIDALTYGYLADRSSLSHRNASKWTNAAGEVYIRYRVADLMDLLHSGKDMVRKILKRLVDAGLIRLRRTAIGKPYEIVVYDLDTADYSVSQDDKCAPNNTETNDPDANDPDINPPHPINISRADAHNIICANIDYHDTDATIVGTIIDQMVDVIVDPAPTVRIGGVTRAKTDVVNTLLCLSRKNIDYAVFRIQQNFASIRSLRGYILMTLWDSVTAVNLSNQQPQQYDDDLVAAAQRMINDTDI